MDYTSAVVAALPALLESRGLEEELDTQENGSTSVALGVKLHTERTRKMQWKMGGEEHVKKSDYRME
jgi:hypothetical protein